MLSSYFNSYHKPLADFELIEDTAIFITILLQKHNMR